MPTWSHLAPESWSILIQVKACCLTTPSHGINQYRHIVNWIHRNKLRQLNLSENTIKFIHKYHLKRSSESWWTYTSGFDVLTLASTQLSLLFDSTSYCFRPFSKEWSMIPPLYKIEIQCIKWRATLSNNHIFQPTVCSEQFSITNITLRWRHNDRDGVWNHQPHDCLLNRLFRRKSKKTSKLRVTGLCAWNSPVTGEFPAQRASNAENVSIWWCRHGMWCL